MNNSKSYLLFLLLCFIIACSERPLSNGLQFCLQSNIALSESLYDIDFFLSKTGFEFIDTIELTSPDTISQSFNPAILDCLVEQSKDDVICFIFWTSFCGGSVEGLKLMDDIILKNENLKGKSYFVNFDPFTAHQKEYTSKLLKYFNIRKQIIFLKNSIDFSRAGLPFGTEVVNSFISKYDGQYSGQFFYVLVLKNGKLVYSSDRLTQAELNALFEKI